MKVRTAKGACGLVALVLGLGCGCAQQQEKPFSILDPLGIGREVFGIGQEPVRVGITMVHTSQSSAAPWMVMQRRLQRILNKPVQFESLEPFQIKAHLASGRLQFALVEVGDEEEILNDPDVGRIIASPRFEEGANRKRALLITAADSKIESIEDLTGKHIAFGPIGNPLTHVAAIQFLESNGISLDSIPRELLPIPGTLRHHINSLETAKAVVYERALGVSAGFVEKRDFDRWPEEGGTLLLLRVSKDQFRILGETEPVPDLPGGPVLASGKADAELVDRVSQYLTEELPKDKKACSQLGLVCYVPPSVGNGTLELPETRAASHE